ncbi:unnamed protein product [Closterium sp. NIES-65]|nr:unnamed protein product [Closterium sp. NIES-65]
MRVEGGRGGSRSFSSTTTATSTTNSSSSKKKSSKPDPPRDRPFIDRLRVRVEGGRGGSGCSSFRKSRHARHGDRDGGNGGEGGGVTFIASAAVRHLGNVDRTVKGGAGGHGSSKKRVGAKGVEREVRVPVGTAVYLLEGEVVLGGIGDESGGGGAAGDAGDASAASAPVAAAVSAPTAAAGSSSMPASPPWWAALFESSKADQEEERMGERMEGKEVEGEGDGEGEGEGEERKVRRRVNRDSYWQQLLQQWGEERYGQRRARADEGGNGRDWDEGSENDSVLQSHGMAHKRAQERGVLVADLVEEGQSVTVAVGGPGGRGNASMGRVKPWEMETEEELDSSHGKGNARCRAVQGGAGAAAAAVAESGLGHEKGSPGSRAVVALELKTVADVGLVGLPNAGKSSLLRALSRAKPRVGWHPFTTLHPQLGSVMGGGESAWEGEDGVGGGKAMGEGEARGDDAWNGERGEEEEGDEIVWGEDRGFAGGSGERGSKWDLEGEMGFTVADIPGLIGGAHRDRGLGLSFVRHVERTKVIVYVLDMSGSNTSTVSSEPHASEPGACEASATEPTTTEPSATERSSVSAGALPPWQQLQVLVSELERYQPGLSLRPALIAANKMDEDAAEGNLTELRRRLRGGGEGVDVLLPVPVVPLCAILVEGVPEIKGVLRRLVWGELGLPVPVVPLCAVLGEGVPYLKRALRHMVWGGEAGAGREGMLHCCATCASHPSAASLQVLPVLLRVCAALGEGVSGLRWGRGCLGCAGGGGVWAALGEGVSGLR